MFEDRTPAMSDPARHVMAITPDDDANAMPEPTRALAVNAEGLVMVTTAGGQTVDLFVAPGAPFPVRVVKVWATGTTARGIRGLW